ncbi:hypothetical protein PR048_006812 [Dryococelus australis]|uniref:protein-tyrosine-phosphatase n=1 Tax=Dryococelus australis TaxID=614101 RepID=A0ABQ9ICM0_9NEOP|nr:hypothetical protein PR048_006812 [Dryococelus australis]
MFRPLNPKALRIRASQPNFPNFALEEYLRIMEVRESGTWKASARPENWDKNRINIPCWDHSRVVLFLNDFLTSDHIYANYANGFEDKKKFISTQFPKKNTLVSFWTSDLDLSDRNGVSREICHFMYPGWTENNVPNDVTEFYKFVQRVNQMRTAVIQVSLKSKGNLPGPIIVHCDIGIGRTGIYCTVDYAIFQLMNTQMTSLPQIVRKIRKQRHSSVTTFEQYFFCYRAFPAEMATSTNGLTEILTERNNESENIFHEATRCCGLALIARFTPFLRRTDAVEALNAWNNMGQMSIHVAATTYSGLCAITLIKVLVKLGAVVNGPEGIEGNTVLDLAVKQQDYELAHPVPTTSHYTDTRKTTENLVEYKLARALAAFPILVSLGYWWKKILFSLELVPSALSDTNMRYMDDSIREEIITLRRSVRFYKRVRKTLLTVPFSPEMEDLIKSNEETNILILQELRFYRNKVIVLNHFKQQLEHRLNSYHFRDDIIALNNHITTLKGRLTGVQRRQIEVLWDRIMVFTQTMERLRREPESPSRRHKINKIENDIAILVWEEHQRIVSEEEPGTWNAFEMPRNRDKNRSSFIPCLDSTRVILEPSSPHSSDYIHANYVDGFEDKRKFICTQAPMSNTFESFYNMMWYESCCIIVMLMNPTPNNVQQFYPYWSCEASGIVESIYFRVKTVATKSYDYFMMTVLRITEKYSKCSRNICHFTYMDWSLNGIPSDVAQFYEFIRKVNQVRSTIQMEQSFWPKLGRIIVHCSTGIGRTRIFCTADVALFQIIKTSRICLPKIVKSIRQQRHSSVNVKQSVNQALIQISLCRSHLASLERAKRELQDHLDLPLIQELYSVQDAMNRFKKRSAISLYLRAKQPNFWNIAQKEYNQIVRAKDVGTCEAFEKPENAEKNRNSGVKCLNRSRVILTSHEGSDYIHANYVNGYKDPKKFMCTQNPSINTAEDFLRMVWCEKSYIVVALENWRGNGGDCYPCWSREEDSEVQVGRYTIKTVRTKTMLNFFVAELLLSDGVGPSRQVLHFSYSDWTLTNVPRDPAKLYIFMAKVNHIRTKIQLSANVNTFDVRPIVLHCTDGVRRAGLFCAADYALNRMMKTAWISLPTIVLNIRQQRHSSVNSLQQYLFCYRIVLHALADVFAHKRPNIAAA